MPKVRLTGELAPGLAAPGPSTPAPLGAAARDSCLPSEDLGAHFLGSQPFHL